MSQESPCPDRGRLEEFLRGVLPEPDAVALKNHLGQCTACFQTLQVLRGRVFQEETIRNSGPEMIPGTPPGPHDHRPFATVRGAPQGLETAAGQITPLIG